MTTVTIPFPAVGQVWKYIDARENGRRITLNRVTKDRVYFVNRRGEVRSIAIARLRPLGITKGYEFVR